MILKKKNLNMVKCVCKNISKKKIERDEKRRAFFKLKMAVRTLLGHESA